MSTLAPPPAPPLAPAAQPEPAAYANHFEVGFNAFEFLLDFGQGYGGPDTPATTHTRIVTTPAYAKVFRSLLDRSIVEYEAAFGTIGAVEDGDNGTP